MADNQYCETTTSILCGRIISSAEGNATKAPLRNMLNVTYQSSFLYMVYFETLSPLFRNSTKRSSLS